MEDAEYETSEATSLATSSTMEGEHLLEARDAEEGSDTPRGCLSPDSELQSDTPTPTPTHGQAASLNNVDRIREKVEKHPGLRLIYVIMPNFADTVRKVRNKPGGSK